MADNVLFTPLRAVDSNGDPIANARALFFETGTSTPATVYQNTSATVPHSSPVLADSNGVFPSVYSDGSTALRCIIRDADDNEISDIDPIWITPLTAGAASSITFNPTTNIAKDNVQDAIERVQANWKAAKSGSDDDLVSGTAGTADNLLKWNGDGDAVDSGYAAIDEDNMSSNSATKLPTQQSVKAYVDAKPEPALEFISTEDASSQGRIAFTGFDDSKYDAYVVVIAGFIPVTDGVDVWLRTSTNGGSSYDSGASDYAYRVDAGVMGGTITNANSSGAAQIQMTGTASVGSAASEYGFHAVVHILHPHLAVYTHITWQGAYINDAGNPVSISGGNAFRLAAEDVNAVSFSVSSGNVESGSATLYGMKNSS